MNSHNKINNHNNLIVKMKKPKKIYPKSLHRYLIAITIHKALIKPISKTNFNKAVLIIIVRIKQTLTNIIRINR
jgi:hypothetical protein